jgi:two-component system cell cycle sensor histidine kinase/response regulator CckA
LQNPWRAHGPRSAAPAGHAIRAYGLAIATTLVSAAVTRITWPFFSGAPFAPLFAAVAATSHWGSGPAGLVTIVLATLIAPLAFPSTGRVPWNPYTLIGFVPVALVGSLLIAGRNRATAALRASEAQLRATWEHATLGAALLDARGHVDRMNPAMERLFGCTGAAAVGVRFSDFSHPEEAVDERLRYAALLAGTDPFYQRDQRYRRQDGTLLWGRVTVSAIRDADGVPTGGLAVIEDVTAQRQAELDLRASEERLRRAQKMEAVGQLVAGVAHNFNNLLTVTMGYTDVLLDTANEDDRAAIEEIRRATDRGATLTRQLLAFGRKHDPRVARIELDRTVSGLREMLTRVIREDIQLTIDLVPVAVVIDPYDLEQVIVNLVINARDALPDGGGIHIDVALETIDAAGVPVDAASAPGEYARLRVRDNGTGMTPDVESHLFEPFFTTKEVGEGTGLGLAFVHGIARHGGGFVRIETAPGKGTTVSVYLPPAAALPPAAGRVEEPAPVATPEPAAATILLVEDDGAVRDMAAQMLRRAGYRVLSAATPGDACVTFDTHADEIALLLTDVVMPDMHGPALAERLVALRPALRVLFMSGYHDARPEVDAAGSEGRKTTFLAKPFTSSILLQTVSELLAPTIPASDAKAAK